MVALPSNYCRVAIVGASSLRGKDLATALEENGFPATDVRLLDDAVVEGTLTEAGGEPIVIQGIDRESFEGVRFAFFAGDGGLTGRHWQQAAGAGAIVIDLSSSLVDEPSAVAWIPALRKILPPPHAPAGKVFYSPPAPAIIATTLAAAFREHAVKSLVLTVFQPVSERGQEGIEELESQTVGLLSMKPIAAGIYDTQVAFNLLASYGEGSKVKLSDLSAVAARETKKYVAGRMQAPAVRLVQAPVFYGSPFSAFVEVQSDAEPGGLERGLEGAGVKVGEGASGAPNNVSVAGESFIHVARVERDSNIERGFWLWGAVDNLRIVSANALSIAETLLAS